MLARTAMSTGPESKTTCSHGFYVHGGRGKRDDHIFKTHMADLLIKKVLQIARRGKFLQKQQFKQAIRLKSGVMVSI